MSDESIVDKVLDQAGATGALKTRKAAKDDRAGLSYNETQLIDVQVREQNSERFPYRLDLMLQVAPHPTRGSFDHTAFVTIPTDTPENFIDGPFRDWMRALDLPVDKETTPFAESLDDADNIAAQFQAKVGGTFTARCYEDKNGRLQVVPQRTYAKKAASTGGM